MPVITKVDHEKDLTIQTLTGELYLEEGMEFLKLFCEKHPQKKYGI